MKVFAWASWNDEYIKVWLNDLPYFSMYYAFFIESNTEKCINSGLSVGSYAPTELDFEIFHTTRTLKIKVANNLDEGYSNEGISIFDILIKYY